MKKVYIFCFLSHMKNNSFEKYGSTGRAHTAWIEVDYWSIELPNDLPFKFHISAICFCVYRDTEEVPDTSVSGSHILQQLRTACP